jgi:hypothetical protein
MRIKVFWDLYSCGSEDITFLQNTDSHYSNNTSSHSRRPKSQKYSFEDLVC